MQYSGLWGMSIKRDDKRMNNQESGRLALKILKGMKDKPASPYCFRFRFIYFLPHPQPKCEGCKYFNALAAMRDNNE